MSKRRGRIPAPVYPRIDLKTLGKVYHAVLYALQIAIISGARSVRHVASARAFVFLTKVLIKRLVPEGPNVYRRRDP